MKREKGFTLIELMVVVVILGVLSAVALPRFILNQKKAKESGAWADLDAMTTAMEMFYLDRDEYPDDGGTGVYGTATGFNYLVSATLSGWAGPYMKFRRDSDGDNIPEDPWAREYQYEVNSASVATNYTIWCQGATAASYSAIYINPGKFKSP